MNFEETHSDHNINYISYPGHTTHMAICENILQGKMPKKADCDAVVPSQWNALHCNCFFFGGPCPQHVEVPGWGTEHNLQQWQTRSLKGAEPPFLEWPRLNVTSMKPLLTFVISRMAVYGFSDGTLHYTRNIITHRHCGMTVVSWSVQCKTFTTVHGGLGRLSLIPQYILIVYLNVYHPSSLWAPRRLTLYLKVYLYFLPPLYLSCLLTANNTKIVTEWVTQ